MESAADDKQVVLVRAAPGTVSARRALDQCARQIQSGCAQLVVFFHGDGVLHAAGKAASDWETLAENPALKLEVCSSAWKRRKQQAVHSRFRESSLVQFWHHASEAGEVLSFGCVNEC